MQNPSRVQRRDVGHVRGVDVVHDVTVLRHDARNGPGLGCVAHLVLVGVRQDCRDAAPATAARHVACRSRAP